MEKEILIRVSEVWGDICPSIPEPKSMVWMKVQGKNVPNGCIVLLVIDDVKRLPVALVKIPRTPDYVEQIELEFSSIKSANKLIVDEKIKAHIPSGVALVTAAGKKVLIESACDGHPMVREFMNRGAIETMSKLMVEWQTGFSKPIVSEDIEFTPENVKKYIKSITERLEKESPDLYNMLSGESKEYFSTLESKLLGKKIRLRQQHGDFNAYNILVEMGSNSIHDFSVIDWEDYSVALPIFDINHFFICNANLIEIPGSATDKFEKYILNTSWYRDLFVSSIDKYTDVLGIDKKVYWALTPLYFIEMANRVLSPGRQQSDTAPQWIEWCNGFINKFKNDFE